MISVRMDKWLWAARFFKTRALAAKACDLGRVLSGKIVAKAARDVHIGDTLTVTNEAGTFVVEVLALSGVRGPASVAQSLYSETPASRAERERLAAERKAAFATETPATRPSKRDRRIINRWRGR